MTRRSLILEQLGRPEVKKLFDAAEQKVRQGFDEQIETKNLADGLDKQNVQHDSICSVIIEGKRRSDAWKLDIRNTYKWLGDFYKHTGKQAAGRMGGQESAQRKRDRTAASKPPEQASREDDLRSPVPAVLDVKQQVLPSQIEQASPLPPKGNAEEDLGNPPPNADDLLKNIPDYPRTHVAWYLRELQPKSVFQTLASAAL